MGWQHSHAEATDEEHRHNYTDPSVLKARLPRVPMTTPAPEDARINQRTSNIEGSSDRAYLILNEPITTVQSNSPTKRPHSTHRARSPAVDNDSETIIVEPPTKRRRFATRKLGGTINANPGSKRSQASQLEGRDGLDEGDLNCLSFPDSIGDD